MKIGLCGSHRTGKTTLAQAIADKTGLAFLATSTSAVFREYGLDPAKPMDFRTRLWIQQRVLTSATMSWHDAPTDFITDRTPIDFMAYTLSDIQGITEVDFPDLESYLTQCFTVTNQYFNQLVVLQPAIPLVYEAGKAALNKAYIEHLNSVILGLCHDERLFCPVTVIKRAVLALEARVDLVIR
ncbi:AAA family ATPase [Beggiatoa leptomitoformis]|uniref:AAA family ATPase n=1 Tax=Beggiatoa leptomitoformis TaxID=288004 RepID=A0A2N9YB81_9GAMM|nr:AAA family ATPase [Beggiatoa leptomitoformis]ALG66970.1 AAA family ATPase [Beggiatoa leptomitoformis]AUI67659.1 AAA family ATPase [Beggiatoa leptomitoformis]